MVRTLAIVGALLWAGSLAAQEARPYGVARALDDYAAVLDRYTRDGRVGYARLAADDPPEWRRYVAWLESARPGSWGLADRRAFWINAYNARTIAGVLKRYPIDSVRDVGFLRGLVRGFFTRREHPVAGRKRTLDEIEKEILLRPPLFHDRIHWALSCASEGCPRLRQEPYRGDRLDTQLDFQARTYFNGPRGHRIDRDRRTVYLTRILDWYADDFRAAAGSIREYAARYLTAPAADLVVDPSWEIDWIEYDWSLNDDP